MARRKPRSNGMDRSHDETDVIPSSGNVFADLGLPNADELLAKADLARTIRHLIEERGLSQRAAAPIVGASQPDLANLYRYRLEGFSLERLSRMLNALGQDVRIVVQPAPRTRKAGDIRAQVKQAARKSA